MKKVYLSPPHMSGQEMDFVKKAFDTNWLAPVGPNVDDFENDLSDYFQKMHAVALSSGTAAIHLALELIGVSKGDEVICSSFTFAGSCFPILYCGAKPIFVDSEQSTWNMCSDFLEEAIIDGIRRNKKPKAIILVHLYGIPANDLSEILDISLNYDIPIIEDAAEAAGSSFRNRKLGTFGEYSILSFNGNKIITTSGGGALLCKDINQAKKARYLSTQAKGAFPYYHHDEVGYNYRMSNVLAGIGIGQLNVLDKRVEQRRSVFMKYIDKFDKYDAVSWQIESKDLFSNRWLSAFNFGRGRAFVDNLIMKLAELNIESRHLWKPMHLQPVFEGYSFFGQKISEDLFSSGLCLPSGSSLDMSDQTTIIDVVEHELNNG